MHHHGLAGPLLLFRGKESYELEWGAEPGISSNNLFAILNLAIQGRGISVATPGWLASGYLGRGELEIILPEWTIPDLPAWLICRQRPRQTRIFTDFCNHIEERWNTRPQLLADDHAASLLQPNFLARHDTG
ncbi:LysR substrate-binding domain-containing protein [Pantoea ananatis]|uniref:LysR substrate-binding domain-containing protein n=1 Tax=Pantoea ananas TaxID=553 RepID=UPI001F0C23CC|nr:LysR substrate-binding domain-containing protein [Pantoea ananatis]